MILFSETCFKCKFGVCSQSVRQLYKTTTSCTSWGSIFLSIGFCNVLRYVIKRYTHIKSGALITWIGKVSFKIFLKADIFWSGCTRQIIHAERFFCGCHEVVLNTSVSLQTGPSCFIFLPESSEVCRKI